ncbi:MAG: hypothetical protein P9L99_12620 [Candidatus Lernaella stagnicola]|nr:hypothetical protein [Candidatus Lernaella stagnicola]
MKKLFLLILVAAVIGGLYYYYFVDTLTLKDLVGDNDSKTLNWVVKKLDFDTGLTRNDLRKIKSAFRDKKMKTEEAIDEMLNDPDLEKIGKKLKRMPDQTLEWLVEQYEDR